MLRRPLLILAGVLLAAIVATAGGLYWFLSGDGIRTALERQASAWLGQPVRIGGASAALYPRVALRLSDVRAGDGEPIRFARIDLSTALGALLDRRLEDADISVSGGRIEMPLAFGLPAPGSGATPAAAMAIVSIRTISLDDVVVASRGREIVLSATSSLAGTRLTIARLTAASRETVLDATGVVDLAPRVSATITATANQLDFDDLLALGAAFTGGSSGAASTAPGTAAGITASIAAPRAMLSGVEVGRFEASVLADGGDVRVEPLKFDVFGGRFDGWLDVGFAEMLTLRVGAGVANVDMAQLATFGGAPGAITGRLSGSGRFGAAGHTLGDALGAVRGVGEASISKGSVQGLRLLRTVLDFLGGPGNASAARNDGEPFDSISATFALADRAVRSDDFAFRAVDFDVLARGTLGLERKTLDARADVVLSEALSARAPSQVYQFTRAGSRIVLPAVVDGTLSEPRVRIDTTAVVRRGLRNEVERRIEDLLEQVKPPF